MSPGGYPMWTSVEAHILITGSARPDRPPPNVSRKPILCDTSRSASSRVRHMRRPTIGHAVEPFNARPDLLAVWLAARGSMVRAIVSATLPSSGATARDPRSGRLLAQRTAASQGPRSRLQSVAPSLDSPRPLLGLRGLTDIWNHGIRKRLKPRPLRRLRTLRRCRVVTHADHESMSRTTSATVSIDSPSTPIAIAVCMCSSFR
jgi:hypothetical protein